MIPNQNSSFCYSSLLLPIPASMEFLTMRMATCPRSISEGRGLTKRNRWGNRLLHLAKTAGTQRWSQTAAVGELWYSRITTFSHWKFETESLDAVLSFLFSPYGSSWTPFHVRREIPSSLLLDIWVVSAVIGCWDDTVLCPLVQVHT